MLLWLLFMARGTNAQFQYCHILYYYFFFFLFFFSIREETVAFLKMDSIIEDCKGHFSRDDLMRSMVSTDKYFTPTLSPSFPYLHLPSTPHKLSTYCTLNPLSINSLVCGSITSYWPCAQDHGDAHILLAQKSPPLRHELFASDCQIRS